MRNLLFGRKVCAPLGATQRVGYMPDSFGHLAQMPQLLQLAGIDSFIFTRGLGDEAEQLGWLFRWQGPDGSEVLAVNQCDGYCNAGGLGLAEIWHAHTRRSVDPALAVAKLGELFAKMATRPGAEPALINNGCDHFPPQQEFAAVMAALREAFPRTDLHPRPLRGLPGGRPPAHSPTRNARCVRANCWAAATTTSCRACGRPACP